MVIRSVPQVIYGCRKSSLTCNNLWQTALKARVPTVWVCKQKYVPTTSVTRSHMHTHTNAHTHTHTGKPSNTNPSGTSWFIKSSQHASVHALRNNVGQRMWDCSCVCWCVCVCVDAVAWNVKRSLLMIPNTREENNTLRLYTSYFKFTAEIQGDTGDIATEEELFFNQDFTEPQCVFLWIHAPEQCKDGTVTSPEVTSCPPAASDVTANLRQVDRAFSWNQI